MLSVRRKWSILVGGLLPVAVFAAACGNSDSDSNSGGGGEKVSFVCGTPQAGSYYAPLVKGAEDAAEEYDVDLTYTGIGTDTSPAAMARLVRAAINQKPEALAVCDYFPDAVNPLISEALDQGIPVVNSDGGYEGAAEAGVETQVGQDDTVAGREAGNEMIAAGVKNPICVNHSPGNPSTEDRCQGFADAYEAEGIDVEIVNLPPALLADTAGQQAAIKGTLAAGPDIDGILMLGPEGATAAVGAVEQEGRTGEVKVGTFDTSDEILDNVENGTLLFAVWQQPYLHGYLPVVFAALQLRHSGVAPTGTVFTGPVMITKDNVAEIKEAAAAGDV